MHNIIMRRQDMEPGSVIFTEGFSLQDAMSVLEVRKFAFASQLYSHLFYASSDRRTKAR